MVSYLIRNKVVVFFWLASFFIPLAIYTITLAPTITFGDSGELVTAAYHLGISHPPGSPFWTILAKLFTLIPVNSVAWRVNFSSAFFSSISASLFFLVLLYVTNLFNIKARKVYVYSLLLISTLLFSFSKTTWTVSVIAEVWSLNNLLFCMLLLTLFSWVRSKKPKFLYLSAFLFGLSLATHYLVLILLPTLIIWVFLNDVGIIKRYKVVFFVTLFFLLGLSFYLYLPIRARANPAINWGRPDTIQSFIQYIQRKQFGIGLSGSEAKLGVYLPISSFTSAGDLISRPFSSLVAFFLSVGKEFPPWFLLISFTGLFLFTYEAWRKKKLRSWWLLTILCFLLSGWGFAFLTNASTPDSNTFFAHYLYSFFILYIWFCIASLWLVEKVTPKLARLSLIVIGISVLLLFSYLNTNVKVSNWSNNRLAYEHGMNILNTVDRNAIIVADKNIWIFPLLYLTTVEKKRPDVTLYDRSNNLFNRIYAQKTIPIRSYEDLNKHRQIVEKKIIEENPKRPLYFAADKDFENYDSETLQEGIVYKNKRIPAKNIDFAKEYGNILSRTKISWLDSESEYILSYYHLRFGDKLQADGKTQEALEEYKKAQELGRNQIIALENVAVTYIRLGKIEQGEKLIRAILSKDPKNASALKNLAKVYEMKGETGKQIQMYEESAKSDAKDLETTISLGVLYEEKKDIPKALEYYVKALQLTSDQSLLLLKLAEL
ncbi:hypothetical protein A2866_02255, partial [Candidatus Roizmanbacteria bacterium RIFCSPHIGHO2_01_FULL_39_8]